MNIIHKLDLNGDLFSRFCETGVRWVIVNAMYTSHTLSLAGKPTRTSVLLLNIHFSQTKLNSLIAKLLSHET